MIIDTDILIDAVRGDAQAVARLTLEEQQTTLSISTVTYLELLVGCRNKREQNQIERFLRRFQIEPIDPSISNRAVDLVRQYRLSHGLLIADALVAATCLVHGYPLLTKNQRDFRFISGLQLPTYP